MAITSNFRDAGTRQLSGRQESHPVNARTASAASPSPVESHVAKRSEAAARSTSPTVAGALGGGGAGSDMAQPSTIRRFFM